jgi:hypothetical protein
MNRTAPLDPGLLRPIITRLRRGSHQRDGITVRKPLQTTFATKSAQSRLRQSAWHWCRLGRRLLCQKLRFRISRSCPGEKSRSPSWEHLQPDAEVGLELLHAVAERRFRNTQRSACRREPAAIDDLHEIEEVVQIQHARPIVQSIGRWVQVLTAFRSIVQRPDSDPLTPNSTVPEQ